MRLAPLGWILGIAVLGWLWLSLLIAYIDWRTGLEHRQNLELRAWREKVDAMRRIHDREGDA